MSRVFTPALLLLVLALLFPAKLLADDTSVGPYKDKCTGISTDKDGTLKATCNDFFGKPVKNSLTSAQVDSCSKQSLDGNQKGEIWSVDGHLRCVLSSAKSRNGHGDIFDIISESDTEDSNGKTVHWRIDHPDVSQSTTHYSHITFNQGDQVKVEAGGCVRTSGGVDGQRWKQYIDPNVTFQELNPSVPIQPVTIWTVVYAGGLFITDTKQNLSLRNEPLEVAIPYQPPDGFTVPGSGSSSYPKQFVLSLLYYDNEFSDNGYYAHDDGTFNQCANVGPAWFEATVVEPSKPISYAHFEKGRNFDLTWILNKSSIDDNGLPLNPLWSYQVEHPDAVPDVKASCAPGGVGNFGVSTCTSQPVTFDDNTDKYLEKYGYCNTNQTIYDGHINWQRVTYLGGVFFRAFSGEWPYDDDVNFGIETNDQSGQTASFEGPDTGIGLEFKNSDTLANYSAEVWSNLETPPGLISLNGDNPHVIGQGENAVVTGLMGIDGVHIGYSELHPTFVLAIEVAFTPEQDGSQDQTWAFFIRNAGNEGSCAHEEHYWPSDIGDWTYAIQLPWPAGAESVQMITNQYSKIEASSSDQQYLGMEGAKPWTYLRFRLGSYTATGMDGEITLHYSGTTARRSSAKAPPRKLSKKPEPEKREEGEFGIDWSELSSRIADPAVRQRFLSEVKAIDQMNPSSQKVKMTPVPLDSKQTTFTHNQNFGAWLGKPATDIAKPDPIKDNQAAALRALLAKYAAQLHLAQSDPPK
jgi:hypothetical protein